MTTLTAWTAPNPAKIHNRAMAIRVARLNSSILHSVQPMCSIADITCK